MRGSANCFVAGPGTAAAELLLGRMQAKIDDLFLERKRLSQRGEIGR